MTSENYNENELVESARNAMSKAYAPYSGIRVGASLASATGRIFQGCNIENSSYGLTICAERVAIGCAIASGEREFVAMAIMNSTDGIFTPCGACRQVMSEFAPDLKLILVSSDGKIERTDMAKIFPHPFRLG